MSDSSFDRVAAKFAARQHGVVARWQLLAAGFDDNAIQRRVMLGRLVRVHAGVYCVGHPPTSMLTRAAAAVLACGRGAVVSHGSAVSLWGWRRDWRTPLEITASSVHTRAGIVVHRSKSLTRSDIRTQLGIRVTSPARTVLDVAPRIKRRRDLTRLVNDARVSGHLRLSALADVIDRFPRHPGTQLLLPFVEAPAGPSRSELEDRFMEFTQTHGLPRPQLNVHIGGHLVDAYFEAERLVVELDGYDFHWTRESFESDRDRDADLLDRFGIQTVRVTWERMAKRPAREAARLARIMATRRRDAA